MLTYKCDNCDTSGYAAPSGEGYKKWMATIATAAPEKSKVEALGGGPIMPSPPPPPPPKPKPTNNVFSLGAL